MLIGHRFYSRIYNALQERAAYILMERIKIPVRRNYLVRDGKAHLGQVVSELGVYGVTVTFVPPVVMM